MKLLIKLRILSLLSCVMALLLLTAPVTWADEIIKYYPTADASVYRENPNSNYGTEQWLGVLSYAPTVILRTFLEFDLSSGIPRGEIITGANLYLYSDLQQNSPFIELHKTATGWIESGSGGITWNNQGVQAPMDFAWLSFTHVTSSKTWYSWAVPASALTQGLVSFGLKFGLEGGTATLSADFPSREMTGTTLDPYLMVYTTTNPVPLPGAVWLLGSGLLGLAGWRRFRKG